MVAQSKSKPTPQWVIDLHGIKEALTTRSNAVRARIRDAIQSGEMLVMRSVQNELKNGFPDLWKEFVTIKPRTYVDTGMAGYAAATALQESHGSSLLGGMPSFAHFEAVTVARSNGCQLVSAGKALSHCLSIAKKCGLPKGGIAEITDV
ncbi:hypothetical protein [Sphingobium sp. CR28]|uniref:hypothetical protein n=1 Tax=Sphingobium sp. CR28 TaxID=3400272 RepID=UPI003FEDD909